MPETISELYAKIPAEPKTMNLHWDGFDIRLNYDSPSNKSIVTMFQGVAIEMEGLNLVMWLGFKENKILCGPTPIVLYLRLWRILRDIQHYMSTQISFS